MVAAIFARVWDKEAGGLTAPVARHVLKLGFPPADTARMRELAARNRAGTLTDSERAELDAFVTAADLLAVLQSKARKFLRAAPARPAHG